MHIYLHGYSTTAKMLQIEVGVSFYNGKVKKNLSFLMLL